MTWPPERAVLADHHKLHDLGVEERLGQRATSLDAGSRRVRSTTATLLGRRRGGGHRGPSPAPARHRVDALGEGAAHARRLRGPAGAGARRRAGVPGRGGGGRLHRLGGGVTCRGLGCGGHGGRDPGHPAAFRPWARRSARHWDRCTSATGSTCAPASGSAGVEPEGGGAAVRVVLSDGSDCPADVVVVGIGVVPNTEWLEGSGSSSTTGWCATPRSSPPTGWWPPAIWPVGLAPARGDGADPHRALGGGGREGEAAARVAAGRPARRPGLRPGSLLLVRPVRAADPDAGPARAPRRGGRGRR